VNLIQMEVSSTQYASLRLQTNGAVRMQLQSVSGAFRDTAVLTVGFWHHVVLKYQNGVSYMRVDKVSTATTAKAVFLTGAAANVHGGTSTGAGAVTIGPTAFYNQFLSDARSDAHFDGFNPPAAPAFVASIARRAFRGVQPRRRTRVEVVPAQLTVAPPSYVSDTRRTARRAFLVARRDRLVEVVPPQIAAPPPYVPERLRTARQSLPAATT
jgi:hypothetical protein